MNTARVDGTFIYKREYSGSLGYFSTTGKTDAGLYNDGVNTFSRTGTPDSSGVTGELAWMPWLNTKLAVDYTAYTKFDGASKNYSTDPAAAGRNANNNNTLYVYAWLIF